MVDPFFGQRFSPGPSLDDAPPLVDRLRDRGTPVLDLLPPDDFAPGQRASIDLIRELNLKHRAPRPGFAELDARIASYELAYRMQSAAHEVGNLGTESAHTRRGFTLLVADNHEPRTSIALALALGPLGPLGPLGLWFLAFSFS